MKLEGSISTFPLRELIDMIIYSSVTGVLNIYATDLSGHLYFREGRLYHVDAGTAEGVDALAMLLERPQAGFAFVSDPKVDRETLWGDHEQHLRIAERLAARWERIRSQIPHLQLLVRLVEPLEQVQRVIHPAQLPLVALINGQRTLIELARELAWAPIEVAESVVELVEARQAELAPVEYGATEAYQAQADPRSEGGLFDRMRRQPAGGRRSDGEPAPAQRPPDDMLLRVLRG